MITQGQDRASAMVPLEGTTWGEPYASAIRGLTAAEYGDLRGDIAARGVLVPLVLDEDGNVLDGHHRLKAARELGLPVVPVAIRAGLSEEEKEALAHDLNDHRRHLSMEEQRQRAAQRRERVARRREDGASLRGIAQEEGVSTTQVVHDLGGDVQGCTSPVAVQARNGSGDTSPGVPPAPAVVVGKDGKARRVPRAGIGEQIRALRAEHPEWSNTRVARAAQVDPSYVGWVIRQDAAGASTDADAERPRRRTVHGPGESKDDEAVRRATVAHVMEGLRWEALEALLSFAVQEQLSAKRLLLLCREIRRAAFGGDLDGRRNNG